MDKISITLFLESLGPTFYFCFEIIGRQREDQKSVRGGKDREYVGVQWWKWWAPL